MFASLLDRAETAAADDDSPPVRWARNITQRARDLQQVEERRLHLKADWAAFFRDYDVLLCPVMPNVAIPHDQQLDVDARTVVVNGQPRAYGDQFTWLQAIGVAHLPAVVALVGLTPSGLPAGIQIVAPYLEDRTAIDVAARLADVAGGFRPPPGYCRGLARSPGFVKSLLHHLPGARNFLQPGPAMRDNSARSGRDPGACCGSKRMTSANPFAQTHAMPEPIIA